MKCLYLPIQHSWLHSLWFWFDFNHCCSYWFIYVQIVSSLWGFNQLWLLGDIIPCSHRDLFFAPTCLSSSSSSFERKPCFHGAVCSCRLIANLLQDRDDDENCDDDVNDDNHNGSDNDGDSLNDDDVSMSYLLSALIGIKPAATRNWTFQSWTSVLFLKRFWIELGWIGAVFSDQTTSNLATTSGRAPERGDLIANRLQYRRHSMHHFRPRWKQKANGDRFILFQFEREVVKYYKCLSPPGINPPTFTGKKQLWIGEHPPLPSEDISSKMFFLQRATNGGVSKIQHVYIEE